MKKSALYLIVFFLLGELVSAALYPVLGEGAEGRIILNLLSLCIMTLIPTAEYVRANNIRFCAFFQGRLSLFAIGKILVLSLGVWCLASAMNSLAVMGLDKAGLHAPAQLPEMETPAAVLWGFFSVVVVSPILEELFFRGVLLDCTKEAGGAVAIVGSSLLFALAHRHPAIFLLPLVYGVFAGYVVWKSGNLAAGMLMHSICNLLSWMAERFGLQGGNYVLAAMCLAALFTLLAGIVLLVKHRMKLKKLVKECCTIPMGLVIAYYWISI